MRVLYSLKSPTEFARGAKVVARTNRGVEVGEVLGAMNPVAEQAIDSAMTGSIQRRFSEEDQVELDRQNSEIPTLFNSCREAVGDLKLPMKIVDIEMFFGKERIVVYYVADARVDFRELVKILNSKLPCRVEMKQIGARDEAKLLADYGDCGKPVCCNTHLSDMPPVSMKMAKLQKATLDPTKISGRCGRLKCCLRYEYDTYVDLKQELPSVGSNVLTREGNARVIGQEILAQQVLVETEDRRRMMIHREEIISVSSAKRSKKNSRAQKHTGGKHD